MASEGGGGAGSPAYAEFPRSFPPGSPAFSARSGPSEGGGGGGASASLRGAPASGTSVGELVDKALNRTAAVQVVLRIRPMSSVELRHADPEPALRAAHEHGAEFRVVEAVVNRGAKDEVVTRFSFDRVSPPEVGQRELFVMSGVQELMDAALTGINVSVFAYGQTGSGKTYTMSGHEERLAARFAADDTSMGIIPRAVAYLFRRVQEDAWGSRTVMKAAFSEVYNERIYDLLNLTGEVLPLGYSAESKTVFAQGQVLVECDSVEDVMAVLQEGHRNRTVGSHQLNKDSSRSHSVLQLSLERAAVDPETGATVRSRSKVMFVDLAGSERLKLSQSEGHTAVESRFINKSLSTLGKVISTLSDPRARGARALGGGRDVAQRPSPADVFIPYRESMLTRLLQDSLGGTALTLMIACVSPAAAYLQESLMTLNYATRASRIENLPIIRVDAKDALMLALKRDLHHLRAENSAMREKLSLPPDGGVMEMLASMPVLVPADSVLVHQRQEAPRADAALQTEPLHPANLAPRLPHRTGAPAEEGPGKGRALGRVRSRFAAGNTSGGGGGGGGAAAAGGGEGGGGAPTLLRVTPGGIAIVTECDGGGGGGGGAPRGPGAARTGERLAERSSKQLVLDLQQGELAVLSEERDALRTKNAAAAARMAVLVGTLEEQRGAVKRLEAALAEANRGKLEAERNMQAVLVGASAAGWPLPFPLSPPLGPAAPGVVPLATAADPLDAQAAAAAAQLAALQRQQAELEAQQLAAQQQHLLVAQQQHHAQLMRGMDRSFLAPPGTLMPLVAQPSMLQRAGGSPKPFPAGAGARAVYGLSPTGGAR